MTDPIIHAHCPNCRELSDKASEYKHAFANLIAERDASREILGYATELIIRGPRSAVLLDLRMSGQWVLCGAEGEAGVFDSLPEAFAEAKRLAGLE